jgi:hypothetical protein
MHEIRRENSPIVGSSMAISRQIQDLSDAIENAKIHMARTKQAMTQVERTLTQSLQLLKRFHTVSCLSGFIFTACNKVFRLFNLILVLPPPFILLRSSAPFLFLVLTAFFNVLVPTTVSAQSDLSQILRGRLLRTSPDDPGGYQKSLCAFAYCLAVF